MSDIVERLDADKLRALDEAANARHATETDYNNRNWYLLDCIPAILAMAEENARLREALAPFIDIGAQRGAWGVISKKLDDFAPMTVTVTKAQMRHAFEVAQEKEPTT